MDALQAFKEQIAAGLMEVRPDGTIWKLARRNNWQRVTPIEPRRAERRSKNGYLMVKMEWKGKPYLLSAHIGAFTILVGPVPEGMDINHLDGDKSNNRPSNMEACTRSENHAHAYSTGLRTAAPHIPPPVIERVREQALDLRGQGLPYAEIAARLGISQTTAFRATRPR